MLTREQAFEIARAWVAALEYDEPDDELVVVEESTIEREFGWVFVFMSRRSLEGDERRTLLGNAPFIVDRRTGGIRRTGTAYPIEFYADNYERSGDPYDPPHPPEEIEEPAPPPPPLRPGRLPR